MIPSQEHSYIGPRDVRPLQLQKIDESYRDLKKIGIGMDDAMIRRMMDNFAMDALEGLITTPSIGTPVQFLQNWLPGFVNVVTAARKIDELIGIQTTGSWEDEEIVQGIMELTGTAVPYGDYTNVPEGSWNANFERRTNVRFEEGLKVGNLEDARSSRMRVNTAAMKRESAALALEIQRNRVGFYGYNNGANRTYGFLNDPSLPAYVSNPGPAWNSATFLEITGDLRTAFAALRTQSQDVIDPETTAITLAISTNRVDYLSVTSTYGNSVREWLRQTYPKCRVVSAPELNGANGGENVFYLYAEQVNDNSTDGGRVWVQPVAAKFQVVGVAKEAKGYVEDYSNATAGALCKRPFAVVRYTGI